MAPRFNLQSVLDFRHSRVESCELELSARLVEQMKVENDLEHLCEQRVRLMRTLGEAQLGDLDLPALALLRSELQDTDRRKRRLEGLLEQARAAVESKRIELIKARQDEETLQILKRKQVDVYNLEQAEKEARAQDDIYIAHAYRRRLSEASPNG
ncbi:MAG: hypothetical protein AB1453_05540 [Chloroflexota bacterium]